jgi:hypothetical protein
MNTTYLSNLNRYLILNEIEKTFKVDKVDIYNISTASRKQYEIKSYIQLEDDEVFFKLSESNAFFMFLSKILLDRDIKCNNEYLYTLVFYSGLDLLYQKIDYNKPVTVISISYLLSIIDSKYESEKNNNISADKVIY